MATTTKPATVHSPPRIRVFVDYWNFQLSLNEVEAKKIGASKEATRFRIDWKQVGPWLAHRAAQLVGLDDSAYSFDGVIIYSSYNPKTETDRGFHRWMTTWLDRQPGISVECRERRRKAPPRCPARLSQTHPVLPS